MGYVPIYIYIEREREEAAISFSNSSKYLDQAHPSWTEQV
jgi:hypothetical protein